MVQSDTGGRATFFARGGPGEPMGRATEMVLYQAEWCPYCARVRKKLTDLLLDYKTVNVPHSHAQRDEVKEVSGQTSIPVLVDGTVILDDDDDIIPYLDKTYGAKATA
jgi:glutathione S-transferase